MKLPRRRFLRLAAGAAVLPTASRLAGAETYPSRPITMVVPFPAGGPTDTLARILADRMSASLGQSVIIENVSGASGSVGLGRVARASPDGYTLIIGHWGTHVVIGATMKLSFDVLNDFEPISLLADTPIWMVARNDFPAKNLAELIVWLKQNPGKALAGPLASEARLILRELFRERHRHEATVSAISRRRAAEPGFVGRANRSLLGHGGGHLPVCAQWPNEGLRRDGEIALVGHAGSSNHGGSWSAGPYASFWHGLWAPKGTPKDIIVRLNSAVRSALADPRYASAIPTRAKQFRHPTSNSGSARQIAESRNREVVADHQGGRHRGRVSQRTDLLFYRRLS